MEDANPYVTRKRPRLDSGERSRRSMSTDELAISEPQDEAMQPYDEGVASGSQHNPSALLKNGLPSPTGTTPSKVTLNLREATADLAARSGAGIDVAIKSNEGATESSPTSSSKKASSPSPEIISVASTSPPHSPEIQIAEIEDIGNGPSETIWKPIGRAIDARRNSGDSLEAFPFPELHGDPAHKVASIVDLLKGIGTERLLILGDLAKWIESYILRTQSDISLVHEDIRRRRPFWQGLPQVFRILLAQKPLNYLAANLRKTEISEGSATLHCLLGAFAALCARLVHVDHHILSRGSEGLKDTVTVISIDYIDCLQAYLSEDRNLEFWTTLRDIRGFDVWATKSSMIKRFLGHDSDGVATLTQMTKSLMGHTVSVPRLTVLFEAPVTLVHNLMRAYFRMRQRSSSSDLEPSLESLPEDGLKYFKTIEHFFEHCIAKQLPLLSRELSNFLLEFLGGILYWIIRSDLVSAASIVGDISPIPESLIPEQRAQAFAIAWKFKMLRFFITKGRMELRIQGVDLLQTELISLYNNHVSSIGGEVRPRAPLAQYVSDLLLESHILDYLLGPDSHPQLINRASNIVGFLIVTERYTKGQTDIIWNSLLSTEDPRVSCAILGVIRGFLHLAPHSILYYLITKLNILDVSRFDMDMVQHGALLLDTLRDLEGKNPSGPLDMPPYQLCLRLMREATTIASSLPAKQGEILKIASDQFFQMLKYGPTDSNRRSIYMDCMGDLSQGSVSATGSVAAVNRLLTRDTVVETVEDITWLTEDLRLSNLLIQDLSRMVMSRSLKQDQLGRAGDHIAIRLDLVRLVITHKPDSISTTDGEELWASMLGHKAPSNNLRQYAWCTLVDAIANIPVRNSFLDRCITDYLPKLQPSYFTEGSLLFASAVMDYEARQMSTIDYATHIATQRSEGVELLWHLSLVAPDDTVEQAAIQKLVAYYLDIYTTQGQEDAQSKLIKSRVVERCIEQLTTAASTLRTQGTSGNFQVEGPRRSFTRSLAVLDAFVRGLQRRPGYVSPKIYHPGPLRGDILHLNYQVFDGIKSTKMQSLEIGSQNIGKELFHRLTTVTGFSQVMVFAGGQKLDLLASADKSLQEMKTGNLGALMVKRAPELPAKQQAEASLAASSLGEVVGEIMNHFFHLYDLLEMEEVLAARVLQFLKGFPPHPQVMKSILADDVSSGAYFPKNNVYRTLYSTYVLRYSLSEVLQTTKADRKFVNHGVHLLGDALMHAQLAQSEMYSSASIMVLSGLAEGLLYYLKAGEWDGGAASYTLEGATLIRSLISIAADGVGCKSHDSIKSLICMSFAIIIELCMRSEAVWHCSKDDRRLAELVRAMLLSHSDVGVRQETLNGLRHFRATLSTSSLPFLADLDTYLWAMIRDSIPTTVDCSSRSRQFYELATIVFQEKTSEDRSDILQYVSEWSQLLLLYKHNEIIGRTSIDWTMNGIANLLYQSFQKLTSWDEEINHLFPLARSIFRKHLFPDSSRFPESQIIAASVPTMTSDTRSQLYKILLALSNDVGKLHDLLNLLDEQLPEDESFSTYSWGFTQPSEEFPYTDDNWNIEPHKLVRAPVGYPGLRNLSNTCYMNSLLTQLFMNVSFRGFMLSHNLTDAENSQRLLLETQCLFTCMQETVLKAVDTSCFADAIQTYENKAIDVAVQMDVDEFFNLLFDRWEVQFISDTDKKSFRAHYGGHIVQQIKSKECSHISEQIEPFSAIQCEIKGKAGLVESLKAYVEGEIMAGDNKYSCTSCNAYVDAVKRACLKDTPDNLIFHLKRFDYDIMSNTRIKVNDAFEFPAAIDMAPYHVNWLNDDGTVSQPDIYELVGVLVHSGNAESGHYYSFIREQSPNANGHQSWVEFNDADVSAFNFENIGDACYGGLSDQTNQFAQFSKPYNAYMLFYRRRSFSYWKVPNPSTQSPLTRVASAPALVSRYALMNESAIRKLCLFDGAFVDFLAALVERLLVPSESESQQRPEATQKATYVCLGYLNGIGSRVKDIEGFVRIANLLQKLIIEYPQCHQTALSWICDPKNEALRNLLLRCPYAEACRAFAMLIVKMIQLYDAQSMAIEASEDRPSLVLSGLPGEFFMQMKGLTTILHIHWRAWDEYFGLLINLADLGVKESQTLLQIGFLQHCLEMMVLEHPKAHLVREKEAVYQRIAHFIEKKRKYSFIGVVELCWKLLQNVDLNERQGTSPQDRLFKNDGYSALTVGEYKLIESDFSMTSSIPTCVFLEKAIHSHASKAAKKDLVRMLLLAEEHLQLADAIRLTLMDGFLTDPASLAVPFLDAALVYCEVSSDKQGIQDILRKAASDVESIGPCAGAENLQFFKAARRLHNITIKWGRDAFEAKVRTLAYLWGPPLLTFHDIDVRLDTLDFLENLIFSHNLDEIDNERKAERISKAGRDLCGKSLERLQYVVSSNTIQDKALLEQITRIVSVCLDKFFDENYDDDERTMELAKNTFASMQRLMVEESDGAVSEGWQGNESDNISDTESNISAPS